MRDNFLRKCEPSQSKKVLVKLRNGLKFLARTKGHDLGFIVQIFSYDEYRFPRRKMGMVIDVGAHIGIFTCLAASYADKVIAIEPCPDNFSLLKENIKLNGFKNVIPIQMALAGRSGTRTLFISKYGTGNHSLVPFDIKDIKDAIECKTCTLEELLKTYKIERVSFMKVDCEGCEYEVLDSSRNILDKIERIAVDSHHGYTDKLVELLKEEGFIVESRATLVYAVKGDA